jgi:hypothetical protein
MAYMPNSYHVSLAHSYRPPQPRRLPDENLHAWLAAAIPRRLLLAPMSARELASAIDVNIHHVEENLHALRTRNIVDWLLNDADQCVMREGGPVWMALV